MYVPMTPLVRLDPPDAVSKRIDDTVWALATEAKRTVCVVSGDLQRSIEADSDGEKGVYFADTHYALEEEYRHPYLRRALDSARSIVQPIWSS
jgi:hypothetical protein